MCLLKSNLRLLRYITTGYRFHIVTKIKLCVIHSTDNNHLRLLGDWSGRVLEWKTRIAERKLYGWPKIDSLYCCLYSGVAHILAWSHIWMHERRQAFDDCLLSYPRGCWRQGREKNWSNFPTHTRKHPPHTQKHKNKNKETEDCVASVMQAVRI